MDDRDRYLDAELWRGAKLALGKGLGADLFVEACQKLYEEDDQSAL